VTALTLIRRTAWVLVAVLGVLLGLFAATGGFETLVAPRIKELGKPAIGGPFALADQDGQPVTSESLKGRPFLVFFGFTHCPEVCPTTMFELSEALRAVGKPADDIRAFFVSVDQERDTPELLKAYLSSFDPRLSALVGPADKIDAMVKAYRAFYRKVPLEKGAYTIDHTALVYLMGRDGQYVDIIRPQEALEGRVKKLEALLKSG
jgi:protein SCO1/2